MAGLISIVIQSNRLPGIAARVPHLARQIVQASGLNVEAGCKMRSRVDTGAMRNAWTFQMTGPTSGEVSNGTEQVMFNEYGTVHMSAAPMAHPAADAERPAFQAACAKLADL